MSAADGSGCGKKSLRLVNKAHRVLIIDDDPLVATAVANFLPDGSFVTSIANDVESGLRLLRTEHPHLVLLDLILPGVQGMDLLTQILDTDPGIDVILMTGYYSTDLAVEAIQRGAYDFITKPIRLERFRQQIDRWLTEAEIRRKTLRLDAEMVEAAQYEGMIGRSPLILDVFSRIRRIGPHFQNALVSGETGTGKELVAKALHHASPVASGPFITCNCAAMVETLFESELFGCVRGAFTGAVRDRPGLVEHASGGTLFLDEIGEVPVSTQAKLLRLLQNREFMRLGSPTVRSAHIRVVAATNCDLRALCAEGKFRQDLYYRLSTVEIRVPPLTDRREDLPLLQRHFLKKYSKLYNKRALNLTRRAQTLLAQYHWPGNIRELENVISYCCMMSERDVIDVRDLPEWIRDATLPPAGADESMLSMNELQQRHARRVLDRVNGNRVRAAEVLGISRATLYRLVRGTRSKAVEESDDEANAPPFARGQGTSGVG